MALHRHVGDERTDDQVTLNPLLHRPEDVWTIPRYRLPDAATAPVRLVQTLDLQADACRTEKCVCLRRRCQSTLLHAFTRAAPKYPETKQ